jgi:folate-binding Fe-S cluster repair protein YgfZ
VECDAATLPSFIRHLSMYKIRQNVTISDLSKSHEVWLVTGQEESDEISRVKMRIVLLSLLHSFPLHLCLMFDAEFQ